MLTQSDKVLAARPKKAILRWVVRLGGTLLLLFFLWRLNLSPTQIWDDLRQANLGLVGLAIILVFPFIALKAWRWRMILHDLGIKLGFGPAFRLYSVGLAAGSFTPGQAGDAIKAWYLRDMGYSLGLALLSIVLDRLFDVAVLLLLAAGGLLFLGSEFAGELPAILVLLGGTLTATLALALPPIRQRLMGFALKKVGSNNQVSSINSEFNQPETGNQKSETGNFLTDNRQPTTDNLKLSTLLTVFGATLLGSGLALFRIWLLALALGLNLNPLQVVAVSSLATVVSLIPISVGGIGARDMTLVGILSQIGYAREKAISLSTLILMLNLVNLIVGYAIWFFSLERTRKK